MQNAPLIRVFSNPGMQERHWKEVSKYTGFEITPNLPLTVRKLTDDREIFNHVTKLEEISEVAEKEYGIQKIIKKMRDDWEPIEVELKKWRDTGTYIVAGGSID